MNFGFSVYILTVLFDVSNTSYYLEVENVVRRHAVVENDPSTSWKLKSRGKLLGKKRGNPILIRGCSGDVPDCSV